MYMVVMSLRKINPKEINQQTRIIMISLDPVKADSTDGGDIQRERESGKCQLVLLPSAHYDRVHREINGVAPFTRHVHVILYGDGQ